MNDSVTVREGTAAAVFTRQANGVTAGHQRSEGHVFAHAPIDGDVTTAHGCAVVVHILHQLVRRHSAGQCGDFFGNTFPFSHGQCGATSISPFLVEERCPIDRKLSFEIGEYNFFVCMLTSIECCAASFHHVIPQRVTQTLSGQTIGVQLASARVSGNLLVHQRLCQAGGVLLVVTQFAEANNVKDHILLEGHAVLKGNLSGQHHCFWIVCIDVQNGRFNHLHDVCAIHGRAHVTWIGCGETNLVVDDDVHSAACGITTGLGQCQCFLVNTLTCKSSITVNQHWQNLLAMRVGAAVHAGAYRTFHHGVHNFKVRWVERQ